MAKQELSPKVEALYRAVTDFFEEGADLSSLTVAEIAGRAGIGKGTVYEYFSNKEEMIARALFYQMKEMATGLYTQIMEEKDLYARMQKMLLIAENQMKIGNCFLHLMQVKTSNSEINRRLKELMEAKKEDEIFVTDVIYRLVEDETDPEMKKDTAGMNYLALMILSKIITYGMYINECAESRRAELNRIRMLICQGICDDVRNYKERRTWESAIL